MSGPAAQTPARGNGEHVMYVDDEEALVLLTQRLLTRLGYRCTGFSSPEDAIAAFEANPSEFHAVITDFSMPTMTGAALVERLRRTRPDLPVAVSSGASDAAANAAVAAVTPVRIPKPAMPEDLASAMQALLRR
ncbi:MAG: response regulator [Vicinamibacterales bacterium]